MTDEPATIPQSELPRLVGLDPNLILKTFFGDQDWVLKSAVGGVMNASSLLLAFFLQDAPILITLIFTLWAINTGYLLRVMRLRIRDPHCKLPVWNEWPDLFVSGMSWLAITTGVMIVVAFLLATDLLIASIFAGLKAGYLFALWTAGSIMLIIACSLLLNLLLAALMTNFAQEESTVAAFAYIRVLKRISRRPGDFFAAWMLGIGIQWLAVIVPCITVVGVFFLPSTIFASQLISASLLAQAWASAGSALELDKSDKEPVSPKVIEEQN